MQLALTSGRLTLRPYQLEALDALDAHLVSREDNPCVVLPTGSGKSLVMAEAIRRWQEGYPQFRVIVLAHRKELVNQNANEFLDLGTGQDIGIFSAGLGRKDTEHSITFAGIDSVFKRAGEFTPFDVIIVDEAHRIPAKGEGKYREFIRVAQLQNPLLRVVGFTATPFRMGCGPICHKNHILNHIVYEANVGVLISQGYLCMLRSKVGAETPDMAGVTRNSGGDYITSSLAKAVGGGLVERAVASAVGHIRREERRSVVWFCVDVEHCHQVEAELARHGIFAGVVTGSTSATERDRIVKQFQSRQITHVVNCNVFTEGFNVKHVDCIVLLRPTLSKGLYAQMVGRGLRLHPDKKDCLILDYAHCIDTHGPIDCLVAGDAKLEVCADCREVFSRAIRICPRCGWEIPKQEIERREREEAERRMHEARAAQAEILGRTPEDLEVDDVFVDLHRKDGSPDSLRVSYRCGLTVVREWVCLDHPGFAGQKARQWWARRFGDAAATDVTVQSALQNLFLSQYLKAMTESITVVRPGRYHEIVSHKLKVPS
jgi:DNA repair protein RadD